MATGAERTRSSDCAGDAGLDRPAPTQGVRSGQVVADAGRFLKELKRWEGEHPFMYVDTRGHVTTGIGHLLKTPNDALKLPWQHGTTGQPATQADIKAAFERVADAWTEHKHDHPEAKGMPLNRCVEVSDLVLPAGYSAKLATDRLNGEFLKGLRGVFPSFDSFPMPAQRALVDMAYNLGVARLEQKFPRLVAACRAPAPDFATAAAESHRSSSRESRNRATRDLFLEAARLREGVQVMPREIRS